MIKIEFDPTTLVDEDKTWWDKWAAKAEQHRAALIANKQAGTPWTFENNIWSELKAWLLEKVFHGKCAYCEVKVTPGFFGDAEHYRPKANVSVMADSGKCAATLASGEAHCGYYWLAYDWRNLLPSCSRCNNAKSDLFPVEADYAIIGLPTTEALNLAERPLLLYPYGEDPSTYIRFGKNGVVTAIDGNPRGKATIEILGLDRKDLSDARWTAQAQALQGLESEIGQLLSKDDIPLDRKIGYMGRQANFSRAVAEWYVERLRLISPKAEAEAWRAHAGTRAAADSSSASA